MRRRSAPSTTSVCARSWSGSALARVLTTGCTSTAIATGPNAVVPAQLRLTSERAARGLRERIRRRRPARGRWEWTDSPWGRGSPRALITVRGGNAQAGELVGRCANAMGRPAQIKSSTVGFRCCGGPRNSAEIVLSVDKITKLKHRDARDSALTTKLTGSLPAAATADLPPQPPFQVDRLWDWWPIGNERLVLGGGCAGGGGRGASADHRAATLAGVQVLDGQQR